jgi:conjugal transfer pilus assembly protein TraW
VSWGTPLLLIDGDDAAQKKLARASHHIVVLVKGSPLGVEKEIGRPVYFDQGGILVRRFGIQAIPARIFQEGMHLVVEEFRSEEGDSS